MIQLKTIKPSGRRNEMKISKIFLVALPLIITLAAIIWAISIGIAQSANAESAVVSFNDAEQLAALSDSIDGEIIPGTAIITWKGVKE
jgi:hypothetical protein